MAAGDPPLLDAPPGLPAALADLPPEVVARIERELEIRGENVTPVELERILRGQNLPEEKIQILMKSAQQTMKAREMEDKAKAFLDEVEAATDYAPTEARAA